MKSNNFPLASIVILTYKRFDTLQRAIDSVFMQNYPRIELIVQDDGSTNYDDAVVANMIKQHNNNCNIENIITHSNQKNQGTVKNFNCAVGLCSGDIIIPLASDDEFYSSDAVSSIMNVFAKSEVDVCTARRLCRQTGRILPTEEDAELLKKGDRENILSRLFYANFISGSCTSYRREYLRYMGGFDEDYCLLEDYPIVIKTALEKREIAFLEKTTIIYDEGGVSSAGVKAANVNPLYINDIKMCYEKEILPNLNKINNKKLRRFIAFTYNHIFAENSAQKMIRLMKYPDMLVHKVCLKISNKDEYRMLTQGQ